MMDLQGQRVMVIGGAGFIGSHVVDHLLREPVAEVVVFGSLKRTGDANLSAARMDSRVTLVEGSVTDPDSLRAALRNIDGLCLMASLWMNECADNPRAALNVNVVGAFNVAEACRDVSVKRVVYASSASVYGENSTSPVTESDPLEGRTIYSATKIAAEQLFRAFYAQYGLPSIMCRYTNVYGVRQTVKGKYASVLIKVLERITRGQRPLIYGDGSQAFDFIDVRDAARATVLALKADVVDEAFNIASGVSTSIRELVHGLLEFSGSDLQPEFVPQAKAVMPSVRFSTEKAQSRLGFRAEIDLEKGLRDFVQCYKESESR
jgi:UDP-glucose 4-epimerase